MTTESPVVMARRSSDEKNAALRSAGDFMKRLLTAMVAALASTSLFAEAYVGAAGSLVLPQGGSETRRIGGATLRAGAYVSEFVALEGEAAWLEDSAGLGVAALVHAQAWQVYGDLFGYASFDPFMTVGACGRMGGEGQVGPRVGVGAFWHLDDRWSLRADAGATLGLDADVEMEYAFALGVQYSF